jgi:hypothetical protein
VNSPVRRVLGGLKSVFDRDPLEQSIAERLTKSVLAVGLLWCVIYWALS